MFWRLVLVAGGGDGADDGDFDVRDNQICLDTAELPCRPGGRIENTYLFRARDGQVGTKGFSPAPRRARI